MPPLFYCPTLASAGTIELPEAEAHHLAHVLRLKAGDAVELFNGNGLVGQGVVEKVGKRTVACDVTSVAHESPPTPEITLATAVPKGERFDWLVEKATELGVSRLVPLITERSTVDPRESKLDRLRQTIIAACKQSGRSHLMELTSPMTWKQFLSGVGQSQLVVAHPFAPPIGLPNFTARNPGEAIVLAVGPEGGFTDEELALAEKRGARLISLGRHILRIETAGLALAAWGLMCRGE